MDNARKALSNLAVSAVVSTPHVTGVLVRSTIVAALGGLLFGFDTAVIAGTTKALSQVFSLTPQTLGLTVSSALWGTIIGAVLAGYAGDRWGRRDSLRIMAGLYLVSAIGCGLSWSWSSLLFFRILGGAGIGGSSVLGPIYIAEISPAPWRGRLVGVFQINIVIGILTAYLSNYLIALAAFGTREWRWQFGIAALPSLTFLLLLFAIPRSPRWLIKKNRMTEAKHSLIAIGEPNVDRELADIGLSLVLDEEKTGGRLFSRAHRLPIFLGISVAVFSQLSGINAVLYYLNDIFAVAGFTKISSAVQAVVIGLTFLVFTLFAMALIDKAGRRVLLLTGAIGMASTLTGIAAIVANQSHKELLLWLLMVYIASFSFSLGAVTWVYISEVFPTAVRAKGQSLGSLSHWFTNAIISGVFPTLEAKSVAAPFLFFAVMMVIQFFVVLTVYPETKNTSLERLNLA